MPRIRIFISFDAEHDGDLHDRLRAECAKPTASFELAAHSQGAALTEAWAASSRTRIRSADEVVVICGEHTEDCERVAAELRIAQEEDKPYMLLWGRRERMCTKPVGAKSTDAMYSWTPDILETQLSAVLRNANPPAVPESLKRPSA